MDSLDSASNDACQSEEAKAVTAMKEELPNYVMESFVAAGFDTLKVISEIDTDKDLLEIEQFITNECYEDTRFKPGFSVSGHFKFLPGHRRRIINFINDLKTRLKQETAKNKLKRPKQSINNKYPLEAKRIKLESNLDSTTSSDQATSVDPEDQATLVAKIRQQVAKWQRSQKLDKLKEFKHFDVNVDIKGKGNLCLSITCNICGSRCLLSHKNEHILISNWTRHVSKCVGKIRKPISSRVIKDFYPSASKKHQDFSTSESPSPLPQSPPDEVQTFCSSSADLPFKATHQSDQSSVTPCTTDDDTSSNVDQVSITETSCSQLNSDHESVYLTDESIAEPHTDWSRSARKKLALLKSGSAHDQAKITSFFDLVDNVNSILNKHPEISQMFNSSSVETATETTVEKSIQFSPLFKCLIRNAEKNLEKLPQQVRHNSLLKKFATSLLIYCGPMAYNFICCNMPRALPSLRTVQRIIAAEYSPFQEGTFRFDELLEHIKCFDASKVVSLGEDSTRVVSGVHYDAETNKLVGFVLPCNNDGLPICDSFLATSFEAMETSFKEGSFAKYAFVHMIQPLTVGVPAFCLACIGTDNKFDAELVIKRWHYIHNELNQRGIMLVSIGADGDSRELKAMQVSTQLLSSTQNSSLSLLSSINNKITVPSEWKKWFAMKRPASVAYIQDMVHVAVKLKTRFLQPSIILPFGNYLAGVHHLRIIQRTFSKDQHGLREKDINYKDKQNYEAVLRMTSDSVTTLLSKLPDAKGTAIYLRIMKSVTDSFLDKSIEAFDRVKNAWYAVFVLRYWRQWIVLHPDYTIGRNFITCNTNMCIELNAHSLLTYILSIQSLLPPESENFIPWLLGSQCCEKVFRAARSMSSTFSTIINFGLLGLLRRFNRLQIQLKLESECDETSIRYPRAEAHKKKDGHCKPGIYNIHVLTKENILKAVERARELAKETIEDLGMAEMLRSNGDWDNPPIPGSSIEVSEEDDQDDDDDYACNDNLEDIIGEVNCNVDPGDVLSGIAQLTKAELIDQELKEHLNLLHKGTFKKVESTGLPIYQLEHDSSSKTAHKPKFCAFVEVEYNKKKVFIHKTTATWLLQEGERVSSDRLFRVRTKQPFSVDTNPKACVLVDIPTVCSTVDIGNICIFKSSKSSLKIGRLLQFAYYLEKRKGSQQYRGLTAKVNEKKVGVICTWFVPCDGSPRKYSLVQGKITNEFVPITTYLCTLSHGCLENFENSNIPPAINGSYDVKNAELIVSQNLVLTEAAAMNVMNLLQDSNAADTFETASTSKQASKKTSAQTIVLDDRNTTSHCKSVSADQWVTCGKVSLTKKDKQHILLGKELSDLHVNAYHSIARKQFPLVGGLYNTLVLKKMSLAKDGCDHEHAQTLQIIHIKERSHWAALQLVKSEIYLYDSLFSSASTETLELLAQLVKTGESFFSINIMNVQKQTGTSDCGLFAIAAVTCLLFDGDPTTIVFNQKELRLHFIKILETNMIAPFPSLKSRRPAERISRVQHCQVYCICRLPDIAGDEMVSCDDCQEWYHLSCLNLTESPSTENWFCNKCLSKSDLD